MMSASWSCSDAPSRRCTFATLLAAAAAVVLLGAPPVIARDGVTGCSVAEEKTEAGKVWRHKVDVQVPEGGHCRIYIGEDKDRKSWRYCALKRAAENPVSITCDDPLDDKDFDGWKGKAVCGGKNHIAYCRREKPLQPGHISGD